MSHWFAKWFGCGVVILCVDGRFSFSFALKGNWRFPFWNRAMNWDFRGRKWKAVSVDNDNQNRIGFLSKVFKVNGPFHHHHHHHQPTNRRYIARAMNDCSCMAFWKRDRKVFCMQIFQLVILMTATDNNSTILTSKKAYSIFLTFTQFYIISLLPFLLHISTLLFLFFFWLVQSLRNFRYTASRSLSISFQSRFASILIFNLVFVSVACWNPTALFLTIFVTDLTGADCFFAVFSLFQFREMRFTFQR